MFGKNAVSGPRAASEGFLVNEIFYTIQGEGPWAGKPTIFLRLAKCNLRCHFCFPAATTIMMADGMAKHIVDIRRGDMVMSYADRVFRPARVRKLLVSEASALVAISNDTSLLCATPNHPILTRNRGFVPAGELVKSDRLKAYTYKDHLKAAPKSAHTHNAPNMHADETINSIRRMSPAKFATRPFANGAETAKVYNLSVPETHTYIANGVVVHNCDTEFETGELYSVNELSAELQRMSEEHRCTNIVITGGEPMLQAITLLVTRPSMLSKNFQIETAGTVWPEGFTEAMRRKHITIVCSPKTPNVHKEIIAHAAAWKYIVGVDNVSPDDGLPILSTQIPGKAQRIFRPFDDDRANSLAPIYVQACDEQDAAKNHANQVAAADSVMKYGYRLSIQMHKVVGLR